jgi:glycosyltransferase involved in cell wall biosynthesis
MTPKVSICIPAYRQTQYLARTLDSILRQDYQNYEVVVTDDSPDAAVETLVRRCAFGSRLSYVRNPAPLGSPANWNQAVRRSRGEYIKILHHDDWFADSSSLARYVAMLDSDSSAGFAFSGVTVRSATSGKTRRHSASERQLTRLHGEPTCLFWGNFIGPPSSTIIRRASFREFPENLIWIVDIAQYIQILQNTNFVATREPLIISITEAAHQITADCVDNGQLNLYEYFFLFDRIQSSISAESRDPYINQLLELVFRYNPRSEDDIRQSGYQGEIPAEILPSLRSSPLIRPWKLFKLRMSRRLRD